jgi:hypothetical protein
MTLVPSFVQIHPLIQTLGRPDTDVSFRTRAGTRGWTSCTVSLEPDRRELRNFHKHFFILYVYRLHFSCFSRLKPLLEEKTCYRSGRSQLLLKWDTKWTQWQECNCSLSILISSSDQHSAISPYISKAARHVCDMQEKPERNHNPHPATFLHLWIHMSRDRGRWISVRKK